MAFLGGLFGDDPELNWSELRVDYDASVVAAESGLETAQDSLAYWQNQNTVWNAMFGDLESSMARYYDELTPVGVAAEYAENITSQIAASKEASLKTLQDRGLTQSGMTAQTLSQYSQTEAVALANSAYQANKDIQAQKLGFYQGVAAPKLSSIQAGQQASMGAVQVGYSQLGGALTQRAGAQLSVEQFNEQAEGAVFRDVLGAATQLGGAYLGGGMVPPGPTGQTRQPAQAAQPAQSTQVVLQYPEQYNIG